MSTVAPDPNRIAELLASMNATPEQLEAARTAAALRPETSIADEGGEWPDEAPPTRQRYSRAPRSVPAHVYHLAKIAKPLNRSQLNEAVRAVREIGLISKPLTCTLLTLVGMLPAKSSSAGDFAVFPSNATLASRLGLSPRSTQRHLDRLEAAGLIIRIYREGPQGLVRKSISIAPFAARADEFFQTMVAKARARRAAREEGTAPAGRELQPSMSSMSSPHDKNSMEITSQNQNLSHCTGNQMDVTANSSVGPQSDTGQGADQKTRAYRQKQVAKRVARIRVLQPDWPDRQDELVGAAQADFSDVTIGLGLPKRVWREACATHGELAVAAMVAISLVKRDIRTTRIAWLRGCLLRDRDALDPWSGLEAEIRRQRPGAWPPVQ